jgi:hypothetical protein
VIFWVVCSLILLFVALALAFKCWQRGEYIYDTAWAVEEWRDMADTWEERAKNANAKKKFWRRRARFNKARADQLDRERHDLMLQMHWMSLAYERMVDAVYRGRRAGQILPLDLPQYRRRAPTPGIPARRP